MCVCVCVCARMRMCACVRMCVRVCVCLCMCVLVRVCAYIRACVDVHVCICMSVCMHVYKMHTYICTHVHVIHIPLNMYTQFTCSCTLVKGDWSNLISCDTAPASTTALVCNDEPEATLVNIQQDSN